MPRMSPTPSTKPRARRRSASRQRVGLALAGGGPLGAIYEIGALCALQDALSGIDFAALDSYVGVSAGGFLAAGLANGMTPRELCSAFIDHSGAAADAIDPTLFMRPAWREMLSRLAKLPLLTAQAGLQYATSRRSLMAVAERLGQALPSGVFDSAAIEWQVRRILSTTGRTNDFRQLRSRLVLVATDLDSGQAAPFGAPGWDDVPISQAVQASAALPGLFPPVHIGGRDYVDGALKKTLHATVLLEAGLDLVLCVNPLVPFDASRAQATPASSADHIPALASGGLPVVLSQVFRSLIHSRLALGMKGYERAYPNADVVLFEPAQDDVRLFTANLFSYRQRRALAEHAYQRTRADLRRRAPQLAPLLKRHGITLNLQVLADDSRVLLPAATPSRTRFGRALQRLDQTLQALESRHPARADAHAPR